MASPGRLRSKVRNVCAQNVKDKFRGIRISVKSQEGQGLAASYNAIAYPWDMAGGVIGVIFTEQLTQRQPVALQLRGNRNIVQDLQFCPHYDDVIASASDDTTVRLWRVPLQPPESPQTLEENCELRGHEKRVMNLSWNPRAGGILASGGQDGTAKIWDVQAAKELFSCNCVDLVHHIGWNFNGSCLCATCKDKTFRVFDPRVSSDAQLTTDGHKGTKGAKFTWLGGVRPEQQIFTAGFQKGPGRELWLLDTRKFSEPVWQADTTRGSATLVPIYDPDLGLLCLPGKGEGGCAMYDLSMPEVQDHIGSYRSTEPSRGFCFAPKRAVNALDREVLRMYKAEGQGNSSAIQPVTFTIPRRNTEFQEDLFPPTYDCVPQLTAAQWQAIETKSAFQQDVKGDEEEDDDEENEDLLSRVSLNPDDAQVRALQSPREFLALAMQQPAAAATSKHDVLAGKAGAAAGGAGAACAGGAASDVEKELRVEISNLTSQLAEIAAARDKLAAEAKQAKDDAENAAVELTKLRAETAEIRAMFAVCHKAMVSAAAAFVAKQQKKIAAAAATATGLAS